MKKIILLCLMIGFPGLALGSDLSVSWSVSGLRIYNNDPVHTIDLDVTLHSRYLGVNGLVRFGNVGSPATGSCFLTDTNGIYCNFRVDSFSFALDLNPDANGTVYVRDADGRMVGQGTVFLSSIQ